MDAPVGAPPAPPPFMQMSSRARSYLAIMGGRHLWVGVICFGFPHILDRLGQGPLGWFFPFLSKEHALDVWGVAFILIGVIAIGSGRTRDIGMARIAFAASIISTIAFLAVVGTSMLTGSPAGWLTIGFLLAIIAKDSVQYRNPLRVPMEDGLDEAIALPAPKGQG